MISYLLRSVTESTTVKTMKLQMKLMTDAQLTQHAHRIILNVRRPTFVLNLIGSVMEIMTVAVSNLIKP